MNNQLIEKVIKSNDSNICPEFTYENPLLDRKVASALARSFVKILHVSQRDSNINNNLRYSVLANIRKICRIEPENHLEVDEHLTNSLTEVYIDKIKDTQKRNSSNTLERSLDEFLMRKMMEVDITSNYQYSMNPEVVRALLNLSENDSNLEHITKNILHWNVSDKKNQALIKDLWTYTDLSNCNVNTNVCNDISIKMKSEIEIILLEICHNILTDPNVQTNTLFSASNLLKELVKKCSISAECFQICSRVLNYLFINTNYNQDIQNFISIFVQSVKEKCSHTVSLLYPEHLSPIVVLLDIELDILPQKFKSKYVEQTLVHLKLLQEEIDSDLILLLSHFPHWFHIYCI